MKHTITLKYKPQQLNISAVDLTRELRAVVEKYIDSDYVIMFTEKARPNRYDISLEILK